ncbi:lysophospholipase [Acidobacteria bacterium AH-259-D05]|nr:lysophospholipase [Acidobacteria bacterium AH-259-D05]
MNRTFARICLLSFLWLVSTFLLPAGVSASPAGTEIKHESIQLKRVGPERRFGGSPAGVLYTLTDKAPKTAVIFIHPEGDNRNTWQSIPLAREGFAAFGFATRYVKEDHHLIMEEILLDLAEAIRFLKQERGFTHVVLHGHSGGGGVVSFYQNQAQKEPPNRVKGTPAGDSPDLNKYDLPQADGLIISAAHLGRGFAVARKLDPSVTDEDDPLSVDPSLDPFDPQNGFRPPPGSSEYSEAFLKRFEAGQEARMQRLIAKAYGMVTERKMYQKLLNAPDFNQRPPQEQLKIQRGAIVQRYMTIYRNFANLYYMIPTIDPNDRELGGLTNSRPDLRNYYAHFHPRNTTPEAFLSGNSLASNVYSPKLLPGVTVPVLVILGSADPSARIFESRTAFEAAASKDKEFVLIEGADHGYRPAGPKAGKGDQREQTIRALASWLSKRFPR